jgi:hypothetical protein
MRVADEKKELGPYVEKKPSLSLMSISGIKYS